MILSRNQQFRYPFEHKLRSFAVSVSYSQEPADTWKRRRHGFVIVWDEKSSAWLRVFADSPSFKGSNLQQCANQLERTGRRFLYYNPIPGTEFSYYRWRGVDQAAMEKITGMEFESTDFVASQPDIIAGIEFPVNWEFTG